jgi:hypothetical protein
MNPGAVGPPMAAPSPKPEFPTTFVVVTFVVAILVGVVVLYLGLTGGLGTPIP